MPFVTLGLPNHDTIPGVSADDHHATAHVPESHTGQGATAVELETLTDTSDADALHAHAHANITGQGIDNHHNQAHQAAHLSGGADIIPNMARIATGTYTGDGAESQGITGVGFQPKFVMIADQTTDGATFAQRAHSLTTDVIIDNDAQGLAIALGGPGADLAFDNGIIALGADGFTVDDGAGDLDPNQNTIVYDFVVLG